MATLTLGTSGNYTWYLDYTLTQSVPNNQSTVAYTLRIRRNVSAANGAWWGTPARDFTVNIGGSTDTESFASIDFRNAQDINFTSGSFTWTHNADGTMAAKSVTGSVSGSSVSSGFPVPTSVGSPSISFPTIPRAATSITRSGSTATGTASTLTISPLVSSFYYVLQYKSPAQATWTTIGPAGGIVGSSWPYSYTVAHAEIPNATSGTIQFQVTTKQTSGGTTIGSATSASFTYTVPSTVLPSVGVPTWAEGATTGVALTTLTNSGAVFAQGWSRLKPTFTSSPGTGATISSAVATVNGHSGSVSSAGTFATPITTQGSSATFSVTATDSRGRTDTETGTVPNVHRWALPTANAGSPVITPTVTTQTIALSGLSATTTSFYLSAAQRNVLETRTGRRDMTTGGAWIYSAWEARATSSSDATDNAYAPGTALTVATGLDPTHEYQVTFQVRDIFGKNGVNYSNGLPYVESVLVVPAQGVLLAYEGNTRVGVKKIPTRGVLDIGGDAYATNFLADAAFTQAGQAVLDASDINAAGGVAPYALIATKTGTAAPSTYPIGQSILSVASDATWPADFLTVVTERYVTGRTAQRAHRKGSGQTWTRNEGDSDTWGAWFESAGPGGDTSYGLGMVKIKPTGGTNITIAANGDILLNSAADQRIYGCFPDEFRWFRVVFTMSTASQAGVFAQLINGATVDTSANYDHGGVASNGTSATVANVDNDTKWILDGGASGHFHNGSFDIHDANFAGATFWNGAFMTRRTSTPSLTVAASRGGLHQLGAAYNGLRLYPSTGNASGRAQIYGYR